VIKKATQTVHEMKQARQVCRAAASRGCRGANCLVGTQEKERRRRVHSKPESIVNVPARKAKVTKEYE
jgi:hypothetical protein